MISSESSIMTGAPQRRPSLTPGNVDLKPPVAVLELDLLSTKCERPGNAAPDDHERAAVVLATAHEEPVDFVPLERPPSEITPSAVHSVLSPEAVARLQAHERADRTSLDSGSVPTCRLRRD